MRTTTLLRPLLAVSLALLAAPREEALLRFDVATGTTLVKTFSTSHECSIDLVGFSREGSDPVSDGSGGWISSSERIKARDEYLDVSGGRVRRLRRTFEEVEAAGKLRLTRGGRKFMEDSNASGSPFYGMSIVYTWVDEEDDYSRAYDREHGEEEWLADVAYDFDVLGLLPPGPVKVGDSWDIAPEGMRHVLAPAGDLQITPRSPRHFGRSMKIGVGGDLSNVLGPVIAGSARATLEAVEERDGVRYAKVALECDLASSNDRTELYDTAMPSEERSEPARLLGVEVAYTLHARGMMTWNLTRGHLAQLDLLGPETFRITVEKTTTEGGEESFAFGAVSAFSGTLTLQLVVRPE